MIRAKQIRLGLVRCARPRQHLRAPAAIYCGGHSPKQIKNNLIWCGSITHVSNIKLIRTNTTFNLRPKGRKRYAYFIKGCFFYSPSLSPSLLYFSLKVDVGWKQKIPTETPHLRERGSSTWNELMNTSKLQCWI